MPPPTKIEAAERPVELVSPLSSLSHYSVDIRGNARRLSGVGIEVTVRADVGAKGNVDVDAELVVDLGWGVEQPVLQGRLPTLVGRGHGDIMGPGWPRRGSRGERRSGRAWTDRSLAGHCCYCALDESTPVTRPTRHRDARSRFLQGRFDAVHRWDHRLGTSRSDQ